MVAPRKLRTLPRGKAKEIANEIKKAISTSAKEQSENNVIEVKVEVFQVGHGFRPFGDHGDGSYIDFSVQIKGEYNATAYKAEGLGKYDLQDIANELKDIKGFNVENGDIYFSCGNFTPDMVFPTYFRKFKRPCKEFTQLKNLVQKKYGIELNPSTLRYGTTYTAYYPSECKEYIDKIKSYGKKETMCRVEPFRYGAELKVALKKNNDYDW